MTHPEKYLKSYLALIERTLLCSSNLASSSGHPMHQGMLRENFVKEFLSGHLAEDLAVSAGEIFDSERVLGDKANQIDVIIYSKEFPKIRIVSENINAFMCESVRATIEVKSTLTEKDLSHTFAVSSKICKLKNDYLAERGRRINCYLVAFATNAKLETVSNWLVEASKTSDTLQALNGVFVLGKGFIVSHSLAFFMKDRDTNFMESLADDEDWILVEQETGSLYALFFALNFYQCGINIRHYFRDVLPEYKVIKGHKPARGI